LVATDRWELSEEQLKESGVWEDMEIIAREQLENIENNYPELMEMFNSKGGVTRVVICFDIDTMYEPDENPLKYIQQYVYYDYNENINLQRVEFIMNGKNVTNGISLYVFSDIKYT
jgi:hypothetical protein